MFDGRAHTFGVLTAPSTLLSGPASTMSLDLTEQFVCDFEEIRKKVENPPPPAPLSPSPPPEEIKKLDDEIKRIRVEVKKYETEAKKQETEVKRLTQVNLKAMSQYQAELAGKDEELSRLRIEHEDAIRRAQTADTQSLRLEYEEKLQALRASHSSEMLSLRQEYEEKLQALRRVHTEEFIENEKKQKKIVTDLVRREVDAAKDAMEKELAKRSRSLEQKMRDRVVAVETEQAAMYSEKVKYVESEIAGEINAEVVRLAFVPFRLRLASLIVDMLILAFVAVLIRFQTEWGQARTLDRFLFGAIGLFSLRTFFSPGNLMLGIASRQINAEGQATGPPGFKSRFFCGVFHYGLLIATVVCAITDESFSASLMKLFGRITSPAIDGVRLATILGEIVNPGSNTASSVILMLTLAWWGFLALSAMFSSWIYASLPYYRSTTLVESMWSVGYQRFTPPQFQVESAEG